MGIKYLNKFLKKYIPECYSHNSFDKYFGKKVSIDIEILLYKIKAQSYKQNIHSKDVYHFFALLANVIMFLENGIIPIYIFDGKPDDLKQKNCLEKRFKEREQNFNDIIKLEKQISSLEEEIKKLNFLYEDSKYIDSKNNIKKYIISKNIEYEKLQYFLYKLQNKCIYVSKTMRQECFQFLKILGVPVINIEEEAEIVGVYLCNKGYADYIYTEDSDSIVHSIGHSNVPKELENNCTKILKKIDLKGYKTTYNNYNENMKWCQNAQQNKWNQLKKLEKYYNYKTYPTYYKKNYNENIIIEELDRSDEDKLDEDEEHLEEENTLWTRKSTEPYLEKNVVLYNKGFTEINPDIILKKLNISKSQFIDFCILLGCDYCNNNNKLSTLYLLKLIKEYENIEKCIEAGKIKNIENYNEARNIFMGKNKNKNLDLLTQKITLPFGLIHYNNDELKAFTTEKGIYNDNFKYLLYKFNVNKKKQYNILIKSS